MKTRKKTYILTEYLENSKEDTVIFLEEFKKRRDLIDYIEKKENKKLNDNLKSILTKYYNKMLLFNKYFITTD